ncbi:uncharacterized protein LOC113358930 [Papaver somniferum]|uniref:uncharacterized protein LOC113358930 n=1 Tax=Papaver somniferum TaxID=3469 RepID=UPI000E6FE994|nr:uncharacterized protein LOC113358930 [Papaver somniferum]
MVAVMKHFAKGIASDSLDDYTQMGATTIYYYAMKFMDAIIWIYNGRYMRQPTAQDTKRILVENETRGFPGMLGSVDCFYWAWRACPMDQAGSHNAHGDYNADQLPKGKLRLVYFTFITKGVGSTAPDPSEFEAVPLGKPKRQRDRKEDCLKDCSLGIHAPSLIFLTYLGGVPKEFILSAFPTLVEAQVSFLVDEYEYYYGQTWEQRIGHAAAISGFLRALEHVKHLSISDETLQALSFADDRLNNLPTFHNVKQLTITEEVDTDEILYAVLKATPNVESLIFDRLITPCYKEENEEEEECDNGNSKSAGDDDGVHNDESEVNHDNEANNSVLVEGENNQTTKNDGWELDMVHIGHLFLHLKSVCFQQFIGKAREMRWVKLILKNAKPLQTMIISCGTDTAVGFINPKSKEELMVEIPSFARASSSCVFKFSSFIDD